MSGSRRRRGDEQASRPVTQATVGVSNQFEYIDGQLRPSQAALFEHYAAANEQAVHTGQPALELPYGPHARQTLDLFRTAERRRAVVAYFHAGYWQSRDKSGFRFLAPPLTADGFDVAVINYPLSPEQGVMEIVNAAAAALPVLAELTDNAPLILVGHSAGAQIAVELAMAAGSHAAAIAGIVSISGVFDLEPLLDTTVNAKLGLDPATARAASPVHRAAPGAPRTLFAVGALETRAFRDQTTRMAGAWADAGNPASQLTVPDADHFSILTELCREDGMLRAAIGDFDRPASTS
ncbi:MAG: alpha/beta hydrolase [Sphingomonadaceae bacterium]|nr:alpha/beta hydrolase [Sphingomonadaceae bacterium]